MFFHVGELKKYDAVSAACDLSDGGGGSKDDGYEKKGVLAVEGFDIRICHKMVL